MKRRLSLDLDEALVGRLEDQAEMLRVSRAFLIETACLGLVRDFEAIDAEEGRPCTCGSPRAHAKFCRFSPRPAG